jgi:hypothetical protein
LNLALWASAAVAVARVPQVLGGEELSGSRMQLLLSALYVLGCAFRSILPVYDIPRIVLVDSRLSSVMVGRSVATIAELSFAAQWALILARSAELTHSGLARGVSLVIVPLIVGAEVFSWAAVLTTAQRGHVVENSLWGLAAALLVGSLLMIGPRGLAQLYPPMLVWCLAGAAYVAFIFIYDVPMYWSRSRADAANGQRFFSLAQGAADVWRRRVVSYRWEDWQSEVLWMSLYFTFGVWSSISLVYASIALGTHPH